MAIWSQRRQEAVAAAGGSGRCGFIQCNNQKKWQVFMAFSLKTLDQRFYTSGYLSQFSFEPFNLNHINRLKRSSTICFFLFTDMVWSSNFFLIFFTPSSLLWVWLFDSVLCSGHFHQGHTDMEVSLSPPFSQQWNILMALLKKSVLKSEGGAAFTGWRTGHFLLPSCSLYI